MQRLHICSADVNSESSSRQQQPVDVQDMSSTSSCLQMPSTVLPGMCLDGGDALMYVAAGVGSVGVVAWLLQQGVGEQTGKCCSWVTSLAGNAEELSKRAQPWCYTPFAMISMSQATV
jgi:hypothetical protein